jgi:fermentation-respiration switch protein FrsA (DUF1100 family)
MRPDPVSVAIPLHEDVEPGGGVTLRGDLYLPPGASAAAPAPGVVMSHGFSATRRMCLDGFARTFASAGLAVCVYDHRNLGDSGGDERQTIDPWQQMRDMRGVLGWLAGRREVDAGRLALWGSSFSGGEVIVVGAVDRRVRAVVANAPFAGLGDLDPADRSAADARYAAMAAVVDGSAPLPERSEVGPMPVVREPGTDGQVMLPQPESSDWFLAHGPGTGWQNRFTLRMSADPPFDPLVCAPHVAPAALLLVVASEDRVAPTALALAAYERARAPKQLERVEGHHFVDYVGEANAHAAKVMRDFLLAHL